MSLKGAPAGTFLRVQMVGEGAKVCLGDPCCHARLAQKKINFRKTQKHHWHRTRAQCPGRLTFFRLLYRSCPHLWFEWVLACCGRLQPPPTPLDSTPQFHCFSQGFPWLRIKGGNRCFFSHAEPISVEVTAISNLWLQAQRTNKLWIHSPV